MTVTELEVKLLLALDKAMWPIDLSSPFSTATGHLASIPPSDEIKFKNVWILFKLSGLLVFLIGEGTFRLYLL